MNWRLAIKSVIPNVVLNNILLRFPFLYRTPLINYETTLRDNHGIEDLLTQLDTTLNLPGNIIECGSSRCGASIIMANYLRAMHVSKSIYACDSFEGFDRSELARERAAGLTRMSVQAFTSTSLDYVIKKIKRLGAAEYVRPIKGFFQSTLPMIESHFCFALIDCDLKDSIFYCADVVWDKLAVGGRIVFDDYKNNAFRGAGLAIDRFVRDHSYDIIRHGLLNRLYFVEKR